MRYMQALPVRITRSHLQRVLNAGANGDSLTVRTSGFEKGAQSIQVPIHQSPDSPQGYAHVQSSKVRYCSTGWFQTCLEWSLWRKNRARY
jgi:hypothetical protein